MDTVGLLIGAEYKYANDVIKQTLLLFDNGETLLLAGYIVLLSGCTYKIKHNGANLQQVILLTKF